MRPRPRPLALALLAACGDSSADSTFSGGSQSTAASATTGDPGSSSAASEPTTGAAASTSSADTTGIVGDASTSAADTTAATDTAADTTADATGTTAGVDASTSADASSSSADAGSSDDTGSCPVGSEGCPCGPNMTCDDGLACQGGVCVGAPTCGDGVVEGGEACDLGAMNSNTGACKLDCTKQACGDGYTGPGEACDDGNQTGGDGCEANCTATPAAPDACGQPGDGVWIEIDYDAAFSPTNPDWAYSPTPGWGEPEWAPQGESWPYINALGGVTMQDDQGIIGTVALLNGTNKSIRVFIGLAGLSGYDHATACVEGRSYSVGSSVTFRVENALNDCGGEGMMANDWFDLHPTNVDLGPDCFIPGNDFQAIEIRPVGGSGSLSLKRMRFTLHGAQY